MKHLRWYWILTACVVLVFLLATFKDDLLPKKAAPSPREAGAGAVEETSEGPVVPVRTVPIERGTITEEVLVYGTIIAAPGALRSLSQPYETQIVAIKVNEGQKVSQGQVLLVVQPSPDALLQLEQARGDFKLQEEAYRQLQRRLSLKLATNDQLLQAEQAMQEADLKLKSLAARGMDGQTEMKSPSPGLVQSIGVQEGSIVPAGSPFMDIAAEGRVEALLGVEPEDISSIQPGHKLSMERVGAPDAAPIDGVVREISYAVDPATRLVHVFVTPASTQGFLLNETVVARIPIRSAAGLLVPRSAVLPDGEQKVLFTVRNGRAERHEVEIGLQTSKQYQVEAPDLKEGEEVVVEGNYELADGMKVSAGFGE